MPLSKSYCPMPFVTLTVNPGGNISRCMMSLETMGPLSSSTYSNEKFQTLRKDMLNGVWDNAGCHACINAEKNGNKSQRQKWLEREEKYLGETGIYENNLKLTANNIYHLYMNFNNICNFKCRMCGPHFSNAWIPDYKKLNPQEITGHKQQIDFIPSKQQVDVDKFFEEFGDNISNLRQIWITGGEPFMDDSIYDFFKKLPQYTDVKNISVVINTNASKVDVGKLPKLFDVKNLLLNISVDATGDLYDYMRGYNYSFKELDLKIKEICKLKETYKNFKVSINGAYQIYNVLNIEEFYNWATNILDDPIAGLVEYRVLNGPAYLRVRHAPITIKSKARRMVDRLRKKFPENWYLELCMKELQKTVSPHDKNLKDFFIWNEKLDNIRSQNIDKVLPELMTEFKRERTNDKVV
jgi:organic radical activating enzyme